MPCPCQRGSGCKLELPPIVPAPGACLWTPDGRPNGWPQGSYLDCCYNTNSVPARAALEADFGVLTHNYALNAPQWCDIFEVDCQPDRSWLPLEDLAMNTAHTTASPSAAAAVTPPDSPHPLVLAAYSARTLQARLDGAKAALREGGPAAATDARLLLIDCLPGMTPAAKLKALVTAADAAMAAAVWEAAQKPAGSRATQQRGAGGLTLCDRTALRAVLALLKCQGHEGLEGDHAVAHAPGVQAAVNRCLAWLETVDPYSLMRCDPGREPALAWMSVRGGGMERMRTLVRRCKGMCRQEEHKFAPLTMASQYSLYFAAYAATAQPGCGPTGQLVKQALASIKRADPEGWVPRLLTGLEIADATVQPSFMLGSKQEAMACCGMLGSYWLGTNGYDNGPSLRSLPVLVRLLDEWGNGAAQQYPQEETVLRSQGEEATALQLYSWITAVAAGLNRKSLRSMFFACSEVINDLVVVPAGESDPCRYLAALKAHVVFLTALAHATVNMPPINTHWQHWRGSAALAFLGAVNAGEAADCLLEQARKHFRGTEAVKTAFRQQFGSDHAWKLETRRLGTAMHSLTKHCIRWSWQAGQPQAALMYLRTVNPPVRQPDGQKSRTASPQLVSFLEAAVASASGQQTAGPQQSPHQAAAAGQTGGAEEEEGSEQQQQQQGGQVEQQAQTQAGTSKQHSTPQEQQRELKQQQQQWLEQQLQLLWPQLQEPKSAGGATGRTGATSSDDGGVAAAKLETWLAASSIACSPQQPPSSAEAVKDAEHSSSPSSNDPRQSATTELHSNGVELAASAAGHGCSSASCGGQKKGRPCAQCGEVFAKLMCCAGCGKVRYYGSSCQRLHWLAGHKTACSRRLLQDRQA